MKIILLVSFFLSAFSGGKDVQAADLETNITHGYCSILLPWVKDNSNDSCNGFSLAYNGYMSQKVCYKDLHVAVSLMTLSKICDIPDHKSNCKILYPNMKDRAGNYCRLEYAVACDDLLVDNVCFATATEAIAAMQVWAK